MKGYKTESSRTIFKGHILTLKVDDVRTPSGRLVEREMIEHQGAVGIIAINERGEMIFVRQYRHPTGRVLLEIPAGKIDPGEAPEDCAARELAEETGKAPGKITLAAKFYTSPGYSNEMFYLYIAEDLIDAYAVPDEEEEEEIEGIETISIDRAMEMIQNGQIEDGKTITAIVLAAVSGRHG